MEFFDSARPPATELFDGARRAAAMRTTEGRGGVVSAPVVLLLADVDFVDLFLVLKGDGPFATLADAQAAGAVTLNYGVFINNVISFLIVAWAVFFLVRGLNRVKRKEEQAAPVEPPPTPEVPEDILLLREIRDNLKR